MIADRVSIVEDDAQVVAARVFILGDDTRAIGGEAHLAEDDPKLQQIDVTSAGDARCGVRGWLGL